LTIYTSRKREPIIGLEIPTVPNTKPRK